MKRYDYAPVSDDAPIPDPLVESTDGDWCDAQEALAAIAALTAENARMRGEVEQATRVYQEALGCIEWDGERIATLTADLARVTGERDGLKMFADGVAEGDCHYGDACPTFGSRHGKCVVCQAREALAACAPPAKERP